MSGLVVADYLHHVPEPRIGRQVPVFNGNPGRRDVFVQSGINLFQVLGITDDRLFLEVTDDPVRRLGRYQVEGEKKL